MSQTEVQLIKADAVQTADIANSAVTDAKISALTASKLTGALPAISGASLTGITTGITQADEWRVHTNFDSYDAYLGSNWERNDTDFALIGSGMTESSGLFSFPATGIYRIQFTLGAYRTSAQNIRYVGAFIYATTNDSSYNIRAQCYQSISNDDIANCTCNCGFTFDVQNTSTHKIKFRMLAENTVTVRCETTKNETCASFTKIGDT